jgi:hypothetical protein
MPEPTDADWPSLDVMTARYLALVMDRVANNRTHAAKLLGVDRRTIVRMLARRDAGGSIFHPVEPEKQKRNRASGARREPASDRIDAAIDALLGAPPPNGEEVFVAGHDEEAAPESEREDQPTAGGGAAREQEARTMMTRSTQASWDEIQVWAFGGGTLEGLEGDRRLAALYEWKEGRGKRSVWFTKSAREITAAAEVDWARFPEDRARQAALSPAP